MRPTLASGNANPPPQTGLLAQSRAHRIAPVDIQVNRECTRLYQRRDGFRRCYGRPIRGFLSLSVSSVPVVSPSPFACIRVYSRF